MVDTFLKLVRLGIGNSNRESLTCPIDWDGLMTLANQQGLSAVVMDGIELLEVADRPPKSLLIQWIGTIVQNYEQRFERYKIAIAELASFYDKHNYEMMILKGYACGIDWPKPEHRPAGDIDIWLFGKQSLADESLEKDTGIKIDRSHHHHTVFYWRGFMVENHYDFINVHQHNSNSKLERLLKELATEGTPIGVSATRVFVPFPNLHALFLLRHTMSHFATDGISLRQLIDWGAFVKHRGYLVDWEWLHEVLNRFGMLPLFNYFNAICVYDLGYDETLFPKIQVDQNLKSRILSELFYPEFNEKEPNGLFKRICFKYRRWKSNNWKHRLCYKDSLWSSFWSGVWSHLLKPSSI